MMTLYVDTSSSFLYAGLAKDETLIDQVKLNLNRDLSSYALEEIKNMLEKNSILPTDIDEFIVVNGPGSFTGIRVGITIVKTWAYSLNKKVKTLTSLEVMALSSNNDIRVPVIDARRDYVYGAVYDKDMNALVKNQHILFEDLLKQLPDHYMFITNDDLEIEPKETYDPDILKAILYGRNKKEIPAHALEPDYLKLTEAEENHL